MGSSLLAANEAGAQTPTPAPPPTVQVRPTVVQPDGLLRFTFSQPVKPVAVKVGNVDAVILSQTNAPLNLLDAKVAPNTPLGQQAITVTLDGDPEPVTSSVIIAPLIKGLKPSKEATEAHLSKFVVAGGKVILEFNADIPSEIRHKLIVKLGSLPVSYTMPANNYLVIDVPANIEQATHTVNVSIEGSETVLERAPKLGVVYTRKIYVRAFLNLFVILVVVYALFKARSKIARQQERYWFLKSLLVEPESQTYSLSRAQFVAWLLVIVWCYLFLYFAHGFVDEYWSFPNLGGAIYTFLISLGTLVAAQATSKGLGSKGAGEVHPSPSDLVVHGGVVALDRVQQLVWTVIALGMFVRITVTTFGTAQGLPEIPQELLVLMGLSSAGYLGGKLVRGPGPVITEVVATAGSVILTIRGKHFSKDAFIWIDGVKQLSNTLTFTDDPNDPKYANEIKLTLADATLEAWNAQQHAITVINDDAQRADWRTGVNAPNADPTAPNVGPPPGGANAGAGNAGGDDAGAGDGNAAGGNDGVVG